MVHTYRVSGMTCMGCQSSVENVLNGLKEVLKVNISLEDGNTEIEMSSHISIEQLQAALTNNGLHYSIHLPGEEPAHKPPGKQENGNGVFYCPMHCEGEKTYDKMRDCPVCGMDLVEQPKINQRTKYTCPMHPEVISDQPGACPKCGMDLVPDQPSDDEDKSYKKLLSKMRIAVSFTVPIFIISMSDMIPGNPLPELLSKQNWNWIQLVLSLPVIFYACWIFFERAWKSIVTWNLNMFTLIGIGAGIAWVFSLFAMLFPEVFPEDFKTSDGTVFVYFEATVVILTLVLLGQLMEAKAHGQTSGAIKSLMKLAPTEATLISPDGDDKLISIHDIKVGDLLKIKPGDKIPVDGIVFRGSSSIDESMITGEPIPTDKIRGDQVSAGTINGNKSFVMQAERVGSDTLLAQLIEMVNKASRSKAPIQKLADKVSKFFVPIVVLISIITFIIWKIYGTCDGQ